VLRSWRDRHVLLENFRPTSDAAWQSIERCRDQSRSCTEHLRFGRQAPMPRARLRPDSGRHGGSCRDRTSGAVPAVAFRSPIFAAASSRVRVNSACSRRAIRQGTSGSIRPAGSDDHIWISRLRAGDRWRIRASRQLPSTSIPTASTERATTHQIRLGGKIWKPSPRRWARPMDTRALQDSKITSVHRDWPRRDREAFVAPHERLLDRDLNERVLRAGASTM